MEDPWIPVVLQDRADLEASQARLQEIKNQAKAEQGFTMSRQEIERIAGREGAAEARLLADETEKLRRADRDGDA